MNRQDLEEALCREGITPNAYALWGGYWGEEYVIDIRPGGWVVYYSERGLETNLQEFDTEDAACRYLLEKLRNDPLSHFHGVVGPRPPAEADDAFES